MATIAETKTCYVCFGSELTEILDLGVQPMSGIFPLKGEADPTCSPLILMRCKSTTPSGSQCGNVQLKHKADFAEMYGMSYGYNSSLSPFMLSHLYEIANRVKSHVKITEPDYILDIGCNDGSFLNLFKNETSNLIGVDPSSGKFIDLAPKEARIFVDFFPSSNVVSFMGEKKFKAISSIAMFYDLDNPFLFMKAIYESLTDDGIWVVELSELREFMKNLSYDQICHEHLLYLDADLMTGMAEKVGFRLIETTFSEINGGSACYYFRKSIPNPSALCESGVTLSQLETLKRRITTNKQENLSFLRDLKSQNRTIFGYGASTKGNILLNFFGLDASTFDFISDVNKYKTGRITPGSRIPIISHEQMRSNPPDYLFVFIWHLREEVLKNERNFILNGGKIIFPLPRLHVVDKNNYDQFIGRPLNDFAFDIESKRLTI